MSIPMMATTGTIVGLVRIKMKKMEKGGVEMKKKLGICLIVVVIAVALFSYGIVKTSDLQPVSFGLGGSHGAVIKAELPEAPETMPYYRVVDEDYDFAVSPEGIGRRREFLPSEEEAVRIAEEFIESNGGMPDDAVFRGVNTGYWTHYRGNEIVEKIPEIVHVGYYRVFNGMSMVGGDGMGVYIGNNGTIIGFLKTWRELEYAGEREILNASEAVERLQRGETIYQLGGPLSTIEINRMELGYYSAMPRVKQEFYEPVWIFRGKRGGGDSVPALTVWAGVTMPPPISFCSEGNISPRRLE